VTGAVGWGRLSAHPATAEGGGARRRIIPTSVAPLAFFIREDSDWMIPQQHADGNSAKRPGLSHAAQGALDYLRQRGASFFTDLVRGTGKLKAEMETALWELVTAGLITADLFDNIRGLIDSKRRAGRGSGARPRQSTGRWSLLHANEAPLDGQQGATAACWMLLRRYGVVFRELLVRESIVLRWRELLIAFRRMEDRGEIRGGRFISGFLGEQFALPIAVESLRATRKTGAHGEIVIISAADPLNFTGILLPGERVPALSGKFISFSDGVPVEAEASGRTLAGQVAV
jgi:ATP-dependent helicase Lhr and Lhr-like helicase